MHNEKQIHFGTASIPDSYGVNLQQETREKHVSHSQPFFENLKWLTAREAVIYLRLPSEGALRNLVYRRQIPFSKIGRLLRFDRERLDALLLSGSRSRRSPL